MINTFLTSAEFFGFIETLLPALFIIALILLFFYEFERQRKEKS
ncbi:MAG: hypothetical protein QXX95_05420 [Nitrososphaerales archaeon]